MAWNGCLYWIFPFETVIFHSYVGHYQRDPEGSKCWSPSIKIFCVICTGGLDCAGIWLTTSTATPVTAAVKRITRAIFNQKYGTGACAWLVSLPGFVAHETHWNPRVLSDNESWNGFKFQKLRDFGWFLFPSIFLKTYPRHSTYTCIRCLAIDVWDGARACWALEGFVRWMTEQGKDW